MSWLENWVWGAPQWTTAAIGIGSVLALLVVVNYVRASGSPRIRLLAALLKLAAIALLAICLLQPMRRGTRPVPQANRFALVVDNSHSMQLRADRSSFSQLASGPFASNPSSRGAAVAALVAPDQSWRQRLAQDFDVRSYAFDQRLQPTDEIQSLDYQGLASSIGGSLQQLSQRFAGQPVAGVLLFTDGNSTEHTWHASDGTAPDWSQLGFPVYPVVAADSVQPTDLRVQDVAVTNSDFETAPVTARVTLAAQGLSGQSAVVQLIDDSTGAVIQQQSIELTGELTGSDTAQPPPVTFRFRPLGSGVRFYRVETFLTAERDSWNQGTATSEVTYENNRQLVAVQVPRGPYRVLYLAGRPNWEFKFLQRAIQSDPETDLVGLLRIADKEAKFSFRDRDVSNVNPLFAGSDDSDDETAQRYDEAVLLRIGVHDADELQQGFPRSADDLFRYHAVILDDIETEFFTQDQLLLIRQFVAQRGGGLLLLGGSESFSGRPWANSPLAELAPVYAPGEASSLSTGRRSLGGSPTFLSGNRAFDPSAKPYRFELTREGMVQPWLRLRDHETAEAQRLQEMPSLQPLSPIGTVKPGATVLGIVRTLDDDTFPALISQRFGKGRSAAMPITDLWRWSMRRAAQPAKNTAVRNDPNTTARDDQDSLVRDDPGQAWRQIVRWLVNESPQRVQCTAIASDDPQRPTQILVTAWDEAYRPLENAQVQLTIQPPHGEPYTVLAAADFQNPGQYRYEHGIQTAGGYRVTAAVNAADGSEVGSGEAGWTSDPAAAEWRRLSIDRDRLAKLAADTGGELIGDDELDAFVRSLPSRKLPVTQTWVYPIWHRPWVMCLAIVCLCGEWGLRRWKGLP